MSDDITSLLVRIEGFVQGVGSGFSADGGDAEPA